MVVAIVSIAIAAALQFGNLQNCLVDQLLSKQIRKRCLGVALSFFSILRGVSVLLLVVSTSDST